MQINSHDIPSALTPVARSYALLAGFVHLRPAAPGDLDSINRVIAAAIGTWHLPARVKRLCLPLYRYGVQDFEHMKLVVAETSTDELVGVAGWEHADAADCPAGLSGLLLHGIYVLPDWHREGIGQRLLEWDTNYLFAADFDGVLVKARLEAAPFFEAQGFIQLPIEDRDRDYPRRYWKPVPARL